MVYFYMECMDVQKMQIVRPLWGICFSGKDG
jgi:hypothetical protein